jgi:hypothetical protein
MLYAWIMCDPDNSRVAGAFDLRAKKMLPPVLNNTFADPWNPMVFIDRKIESGAASTSSVTGLIAVDSINALSKIELKNNETTRLSNTLGGIPSNSGLCASEQGVAYVSVIKGMDTFLATVNLSSGQQEQVQFSPNLLVAYLQYYAGD